MRGCNLNADQRIWQATDASRHSLPIGRKLSVCVALKLRFATTVFPRTVKQGCLCSLFSPSCFLLRQIHIPVRMTGCKTEWLQIQSIGRLAQVSRLEVYLRPIDRHMSGCKSQRQEGWPGAASRGKTIGNKWQGMAGLAGEVKVARPSAQVLPFARQSRRGTDDHHCLFWLP
jgi:hypothetical protein